MASKEGHMQDIEGIGGVGGVDGSKPLTPEETQHYKQDYEKSFELFQKAFTEYSNSNEVHKKTKLKQVMDESLQVMNETASVALKQGKQVQEQALEKSYGTYIDNPTNENKQNLIDQIENLR